MPVGAKGLACTCDHRAIASEGLAVRNQTLAISARETLLEAGLMKSIVFCWPGISGYMSACWRALAEQLNGGVSVLSVPSSKFSLDLMAGLDFQMLSDSQMQDRAFVEGWVSGRKPSVVVIGGWGTPAFAALARSPALQDVPFIIGFDNPWSGTFRQLMAPLRLRTFMRRFACVVVPGERARQFARRLVANDIPVETGLYGFSDQSFTRAVSQRQLIGRWPTRFLFMGRYEPVKGIQLLADAYQAYRDTTPDAWPLSVCGRGSLAHVFSGIDGVADYGFVSPGEQPGLLASHGALVVPSLHEPWGVVIAEGCCAGLPILCTEACGAAVELVRQGYNGFICPTGSSKSLATGFRWLHNHYGRLPAMGRRSESLSRPYAAAAWAEHWADLIDRVARR